MSGDRCTLCRTITLARSGVHDPADDTGPGVPLRYYACPDGFVFAKRRRVSGAIMDAVEVTADQARAALRDRCTRETDQAIAAYQGRMERLGLAAEVDG